MGKSMDKLDEIMQRTKDPEVKQMLERIKVIQNQASPEPSTETDLSTNASPKKYECNTCKDTFTIAYYDENGRIRSAAQCECVKRRATEKRFKASKFTPAFREKTFDNFDTSKAHEKAIEQVEDLYYCAKDFADNFVEIEKSQQNWLVLLGEPGSGKSHLLMAIANKCFEARVDSLYFPHVEGMGELTDTFNKNKNEDDPTLNEKIGHMKKARLLIWDDLFKPFGDKKFPSKFEISTTYEVLNYRYLNKLTTVISSELSPDELYRIDKAVARRIMERSEGHQVYVDTAFANFSLYGGKV